MRHASVYILYLIVQSHLDSAEVAVACQAVALYSCSIRVVTSDSTLQLKETNHSSKKLIVDLNVF